MEPATTYAWRPAACSVCQDPQARLVRGDSDRTDIILCTHCPLYGHLPYQHPQNLVATLAPTQVLAMRGGFVQIGTTRPPEGLAPSTRRLLDLAAAKALRCGWRPGRIRHDLIVSVPGLHGPIGRITVGARSGRILRGWITACGTTRTARGARAVRSLITALPTVSRAHRCTADTAGDCFHRIYP